MGFGILNEVESMESGKLQTKKKEIRDAWIENTEMMRGQGDKRGQKKDKEG